MMKGSTTGWLNLIEISKILLAQSNLVILVLIINCFIKFIDYIEILIKLTKAIMR